MGVLFGKWLGNSMAKGFWHNEFDSLFPGQCLEDIFISVCAFMDDIHLFASDFESMQSMQNDLILALAAIGLHLNQMKVKWLSTKLAKHSNRSLQIDDCLIHKSHPITSLGSVIVGRILQRLKPTTIA